MAKRERGHDDRPRVDLRELDEPVKRLAREMDRTVSDQIRHLVRKALQAEAQQPKT